MDEESLQTALLTETATCEATSERPEMARDTSEADTPQLSKKKTQATSTPRSQQSCQSKFRRLLNAFGIMSASYFRESGEGRCLFGLLFVIILVSCGGKVYFYSALAEKNVDEFWKEMINFAIVMVCFVPIDSFQP